MGRRHDADTNSPAPAGCFSTCLPAFFMLLLVPPMAFIVAVGFYADTWLGLIMLALVVPCVVFFFWLTRGIGQAADEDTFGHRRRTTGDPGTPAD